ncbi:MAG: hypothetical protein HKL90_03785 [Elusimicrobia bacterium]|nr:hypothetical protein [Elusimicrobiota bacterium]
MRYYLFDANVLVSYYCAEDNPVVRRRVLSLFPARAKGDVFLYLPNFCVAEVLRAFAKKCWSERIYANPKDSFDEFRTAFLQDIVDSKNIYSYELSRRHVKLTDKIYETASSISLRKGSPPSAFDVLLIAMGCDLMSIHGHDRFAIVTSERPIYDVCRTNPAEFPVVFNIAEHDLR